MQKLSREHDVMRIKFLHGLAKRGNNRLTMREKDVSEENFSWLDLTGLTLDGEQSLSLPNLSTSILHNYYIFARAKDLRKKERLLAV